MKTDTPRTDAAAFDVYAEYAGRKKLMQSDLVDASFARGLERELIESRAEAEKLRAMIAESMKRHTDFLAEVAAWASARTSARKSTSPLNH